jgi:hypothetical protein
MAALRIQFEADNRVRLPSLSRASFSWGSQSPRRFYRCGMTQQEFIDAYCKRSRVEWDFLSQHRFAAPCDCGAAECHGWRMLSRALLTDDPEFMTEQELADVQWHKAHS